MLLRLKEEQSIKVLPADKGLADVVLATDTYQTKMSSLNESEPYQRLKKDPTDPLTRKLSKKLLTANLETKQISLRGRLQQDETTTQTTALKFTKIYTADIPPRPIVSCVNTLAYDFSAHLANILSPPTGNSDSTVPNSVQFRKDSRKRDNHVLRVESLFTKILIDLTVQAAR